MVVNTDENENEVLENVVDEVKTLYGIVINASHTINVNKLIRKNPCWRWNIEQTPDPYCRSTEAIVGRKKRKLRCRLIFAVGSNTKLATFWNLSWWPAWSFRIWWRSKCLNESGQSSFILI